MNIDTAQKIVAVAGLIERLLAFIQECGNRPGSHCVTVGYREKTLYIPNDIIIEEARRQLKAAEAELKTLQEG